MVRGIGYNTHTTTGWAAAVLGEGGCGLHHRTRYLHLSPSPGRGPPATVFGQMGYIVLRVRCTPLAAERSQVVLHRRPSSISGTNLVSSLAVYCLHFKMETPPSIQNALRQGKWTFHVDIRDAYLHIPV